MAILLLIIGVVIAYYVYEPFLDYNQQTGEWILHYTYKGKRKYKIL